MHLTSIVQKLRRYSVLLIIVFAIGVYVNTLGHSFVYDDTFFTQRRELRDIYYFPTLLTESYLPNNRSAGAYRPITVLTFASNYVFFGESAVIFHLTNVLLHCFVTVLLYKILRRLRIPYLLAFITAIIFAVHPIHVEAVANIKARDELLQALFTLVAVYVMTLGIQKKWIYFVSVLNCLIFLIALGAKEMSLTIPILVLLLMIYQKVSFKKILFQLFLFFLSAIVYFLLRYYALGGSLIGSFYTTDFVGNKLYVADFITRFFTGLEIYGIYIRSLVFPLHLSATYGFAQLLPITDPIKQMSWIPGGILFIGTFVAMIVFFFRRMYRVGLLVLVWLIFYLPVSQIILPMGDIVAERWMYTPSLVFLLLLVLAIRKIIPNKRLFIYFCIVLIVMFSIRTLSRNIVWKTNFSLFKSMVHSSPQSVQAQTGFAYELFKKKDFLNAKKHIEIAEKIYPDFPQLKNLQGNIATLERRYVLAEQYYKRSIDLSPINLQTYIFLAGMYFVKGDFENALATYEYALSKKATFSYDDIISYAATLAKIKRYDDSLTVLSQLTQREKEQEQTQFLMAVNFYKKGDKAQVLDHIRWNKGLTRTEREKVLEEY